MYKAQLSVGAQVWNTPPQIIYLRALKQHKIMFAFYYLRRLSAHF